jgi:hypothetical protein
LHDRPSPEKRLSLTAQGKVRYESPDQTPAECRASMTWAQRLKRVFNIDIETCREGGGAVKVVARIEDPMVTEKILIHLRKSGLSRNRTVARKSGITVSGLG